jgi:hypothetical protein
MPPCWHMLANSADPPQVRGYAFVAQAEPKQGTNKDTHVQQDCAAPGGETSRCGQAPWRPTLTP